MTLRHELDRPLSQVKNIGPQKLQAYQRLGLTDQWDVLFYPPRRYLDYSKIRLTNSLGVGPMTIRARLAGPAKTFHRRFRSVTEATFQDSTGQVRAVWFNQPYRVNQLKPEKEYFISGDFKFYRDRYIFVQPSVEEIGRENLSTARIVSIYRQTKGLSSREIRKTIRTIIGDLGDRYESLPAQIIQRYHLERLPAAIEKLHFPSNENDHIVATNRLAVDEMVAIQLAGLIERKDRSAGAKVALINLDQPLARKFVAALPYRLTDSQRRAMWRILQDMASGQAMNRLLEGDVGSGKTTVAMLACLMVAGSGYQSAYLAPTTILADQHFRTASRLLNPFGIKVIKMSSEDTAIQRREILRTLASENNILIVGTHAVLSDEIDFNRLGLLVIDEQHRFGVEQRRKIVNRSKISPHVLTMTATPIPRSLALTLYSDLDLTVMKSLPEGRLKVTTKSLRYDGRDVVYEKLRQQIDEGHQAYVIAPRIRQDDDGGVSLKSLEKDFQQKQWHSYRIASLHGELPSDKKNQIMKDFVESRIQILISTTVVEVGVDNPNATVMIVESADLYGLAQLHQLRGRVGRSHLPSSCFLISSPDIEMTRRLKAMETTYDGLKLSLLDLRIRGPGALYGTKQHGPLEINFANVLDKEMVAIGQAIASEFMKDSYKLSDYPILGQRVAALRQACFLN